MSNAEQKLSRTRFPVALLSALLASGCGGGGGGGGLGGGTAFPYTITADAADKGMWSPLFDWPIIPIHAVLMPDGRVVNYGTSEKEPTDPIPDRPNANPTTYFVYDVWTPSMGTDAASHATLDNTAERDDLPGDTPTPNYVDFFCSAQVLLPEPQTMSSGPSVLVVGGDTYPRTQGLPPEDNNDGNPNSVLVGDDNLLSRGQDILRGRWYATVTTLLNGDVYIQGGKGKTYPSGVDFPEIRFSEGSFQLLSGARTGNPETTSTDPAVIIRHQEGDDAGSYRYYYPRNFVVPGGVYPDGGRIFGFDTLGRMYYVDPYANGGLGALTPQAPSPSGIALSNEYLGDESTAAMIGPGRILQVGARTDARAAVIDLRSGSAPVIKQTGQISKPRKHGTATILPTGQVVITGGSVEYNRIKDADDNDITSKQAETWDPVSGTWTLGAAEEHERLYHSTALLLADGSVLVGGGGGPGPREYPNAPADPLTNPERNNFDANIFFPPYLFTAGTSGQQLASRPLIGSIPADPQVRRPFTLNVSNAPGGIARVTLVKTGSVTHNFNMDQRFIELSFNASGTSRLDVRMPSTAAEVPPGYYLLFVIDAAGVPSVGKAVFVNTAPNSNANAGSDPTIANPGVRTNGVGDTVDLTVAATDPQGVRTLTFAAGGLPPGLSVEPAARRILGSPTQAGTYDVAISVSDGNRTATTNFVWTVN